MPPSTNDTDVLDIYSIVGLAKRLNFSFNDLKEMSFVSLVNIVHSTIEEKDNNATQKEIDLFLG